MSFLASEYISQKRIPIDTPDNIVDEFGNCIFGTFNSEFKKLDFLDVNKPTKAPNALNKLRLTLWEAAEVHFSTGVLLCAVCDMGVFGMLLCVYYDKRTKQCIKWSGNLRSKNTQVCSNLLDNSITFAKSKAGFIKFENDFSNGRAMLSGSMNNNDNAINFEIEMTRISSPSIVCIPFGNNRPLYSQKDFFKTSGYICVNNERILSDEYAYSIIDDHKGYYPRDAHYDWVTTMGKIQHNGEYIDFSINLTENQSINQEDYNENVLWLNSKCILLPPVSFKHINNGPDEIWHVYDKHGLVDVNFRIYDKSSMVVNAAIIKIDYHITFGELSGTISDGNGEIYKIEGMTGIGEDKSLLF